MSDKSEFNKIKSFLLQVLPCAFNNRGIEKGYISKECLDWWNKEQDNKLSTCICFETKEGRCPAETTDPLSHCRNCGRFMNYDHCCHNVMGIETAQLDSEKFAQEMSDYEKHLQVMEPNAILKNL